MAVPVGSRTTVTFSNVATDKVAVKVNVPAAFSAIDDALVAKVTVGAASFSTIEIVVD